MELSSEYNYVYEYLQSFISRLNDIDLSKHLRWSM